MTITHYVGVSCPKAKYLRDLVNDASEYTFDLTNGITLLLVQPLGHGTANDFLWWKIEFAR